MLRTRFRLKLHFAVAFCQETPQYLEVKWLQRVERISSLFWLNDRVFVYELSGCEFKPRFSHTFDNLSNASQRILIKGGFTSMLGNHKKGIFPLKRAFLGESQRTVSRLSN